MILQFYNNVFNSFHMFSLALSWIFWFDDSFVLALHFEAS